MSLLGRVNFQSKHNGYTAVPTVMVSRSHGILNGFWSGTVSGILNVFVNLVTCGKTLLYVFISVYFLVGSIFFFRMLVKFLHNRPAKFTLEKAMKAQRRSRLYSFFNIGARWGGWSTSRPGCFTPWKNPAPFVQEDGCQFTTEGQ